MPWTVDDPNVWIERGKLGQATLIRHLSYPFTGSQDERVLAVSYLQQVKGELGLSDAQIAGLDQGGPGTEETRLRWAGRIEVRGETVVLLIQQMHAGSGVPVDVEGAGVRIVLQRSPDRSRVRVTSLTSTLRYRFDFGEPAELLQKTRLPTLAEVLGRFGFTPPRHEPLAALTLPTVIHTHRAGARGLRPGLLPGGAAEPGKDYLAVLFRYMPPEGDQPAYEIVARNDGEPLVLRPLSTHALPPTATGSGLGFQRDPVTAAAAFDALPDAPDARLGPHRQKVDLPGLFVPAQGTPWQLEGPRVRIEGYGPGPVPCGFVGSTPPGAAAADGFGYAARTDDFAAVNAYHHCEAALRTLEDVFGLPVGGGLLGYRLPLRVMHRGAITPGHCTDGNCVNAQARIIDSITDPNRDLCDTGLQPWPQLQLRFALADLSINPGGPGHPVAPLGMAADVRVIWHELCHVLIAASTGYLEFPFAHSAGDALAAILCDPGSRLAEGPYEARYRGVTYPWMSSPLRHHNRKARHGWSWTGPMGKRDGYHEDLHDMYGYSREQVLSSTLFRLYRAVGGDARAGGAPALPQRRAAAEYCFYLIARAIASLGPAITVPVDDAGAFAGALMDADVGTIRLLGEDQGAILPGGRVGGTLHKVIRWAFERQGLYDGAAPPVDIFIDDGRKGGYKLVQDWHATPGALWNRWTADGLPGQQAPRSGQDNFVYVTLENRGQVAAVAAVTLHTATAAPTPPWTDPAWTTLAPAGPVSGTVPPAGHLVLGPFVWHPAPGPAAILAIADAPGDLSNIGPATLLPCAQLATIVSELVPYDNNLGFAEWMVSP